MSDRVPLTQGEISEWIRRTLPGLKKSGSELRGPCPLHGGSGQHPITTSSILEPAP